MSSWRTWAGLTLLIVFAVLLYPHRAATPAAGGVKKTRLVLWIGLQVSEATQTALEEFERQNPQYYVEMGAATNREGIADPTRFLLSVAGEDPPDVLGVDRLSVIELASRGAFTNLNPLIEQDAHRPDGVHPDDFFGSLWDETCYHGCQYAIAFSANARALYINDDHLIRAGFTHPDGSIRPPQSWEDICRKTFDGGGVVNREGLVRPGQPLRFANGEPYPLTPGQIKEDDVVTLRSGDTLFRARIKNVHPDHSFTINFARELAPDITSVPAALVDARDLEIKVFDGNCYAVAMTRFNHQGDIDVLGFLPQGGNSWLYNFGWQEGATFMSADGHRVMLDDPKVRNALQYMVDCYDAMGGYQRALVFEDYAGPKSTTQSPFITGRVSMMINGSWFLNFIAIYRADFRFTAIPPPLPQAALDAGVKPFTWVGGNAYVIPTAARHPQAAWELIRYLSSFKARQLQYEVWAGSYRAAGQLYVPDLPARKDMVAWVRQNYLANNPAISDRVLNGFDVSAGLLPHAMFRAPTPMSNKLFEAQKTAADDALSHVASVDDVLSSRNSWVQLSLDRFEHPPTGPVVKWLWLIVGYLLLLAACCALLARDEIRRRRAGFGRRNWKAGFTFVSPWLFGFIVLGGGPILFSLIISFCRYDVLHPAQFVGLDNYVQLLGFHHDALTHQRVANDPKLWQALANTAFMLVGLPLSIVLGLLLALLLNSTLRGISVFRTLFYLPYVVPAVASFLLWMWIFDPQRGLLNRSLVMAGIHHPPAWLFDTAWAKPAIIIMGLWGIGGGMLIWLAGLKAIPIQLYEAAEIDGAGPMVQFFSVTLPMLSPYIFFNTVMGVIGTLQVFESAFIMTDGGPNDSTLFYVYYLFNQAFRYLDIGAASAMAWILFVMVLALTLVQLKLSRKWVHYD